MKSATRPLKFIIDTGGGFSVLNTNLCNPKFIKTINPVPIKTVIGNGNCSSIATIPCFKEFGSNKEIKFVVMKFHDDYDGIIGNDILRSFNAKIDYPNHCIEINGKELKLYFSLNEKENEVEHYSMILKDLPLFEDREPMNNKLSSELRIDHLNDEEKKSLINALKPFESVFYQVGSDLTFTNVIKHELKLTSDSPIYTRFYKYPQIHETEVKNQIEEMLRQNIIRPSKSPYSAPIWVVPKKIDASGKQKWRLVVDYRKLNDATVNDKFPIPNMDDILGKLGNSNYFTTLDLAKGFYQIEVAPGDIEKTAFSTGLGHYEFLRMPFGLKNAPATFQRLMNSILADYIGKICLVYLDDIIIFSTSLQEHICSLKAIFKRLKEVNLKVQLDKSEFLKRETDYLGHIISGDGIKPNPMKISVIKNFPIPKTQKEIKQFLGLTGFYRKFIKDYAKLAKPMTNCLKKGNKVNPFNPEYINAFNKLKLLISTDPILIYPNFDKTFYLTTDASNFAIGAVLSQDGHPICYASRTLNEHEINYSVIEKELLAIVWALNISALTYSVGSSSYRLTTDLFNGYIILKNQT